jgi:anaerobic selenocysteine-containing dehydrogenase
LIAKDKINEIFIEDNTEGFEQYEEEVMRWTPECVTTVTGIPWNKIEELSSIIADNGPTGFLIGLGINKSDQGAETCRAISLLPALLGEHRGFHYSDSGGRFVDWAYVNGGKQSKTPSKVVTQVSIGDQLMDGDFKYIFVQGTNPAMTLPNSKSVSNGLRNEEVFVVVNETHWTETALLADVVLPSPTYLEKSDINLSDHHRYVRLAQQAIEPLGESRHEIWIMRKIAELIGCEDEWLFEDTWDALRVAHEGAFEDGVFNDLIKGRVLKLKQKPNDEYQTQSHKIEFYSSKALDSGYDPLPHQLEINDDREWYTLLNSALSKWTHSQFRDVYGPMPDIVWINAEDASKLSIKSDDKITLFNEYGELILKAKITDDVNEGVLWAPRPLVDNKNIPMNLLASSRPQKIGAGPRFNSIKVKIKQ